MRPLYHQIRNVIVLMLMLHVLAVAQEPVPGEILSVRFEAEELGEEFSLWDDDVIDASREVEPLLLYSRKYLLQSVQDEEPVVLSITLGYFQADDLLRKAWHDLNLSNISVVEISHEQLGFEERGDLHAVGQFPSLVRILKDRYVVEIAILGAGQGDPDDPDDFQSNLMRTVVSKLITKIESQSTSALPGFELGFTATRASSGIDCTVVPSPTLTYPASLNYQLYRVNGDEPEAAQSISQVSDDLTSRTEFRVDTSQLESGEYSLLVIVTDSFFRRTKVFAYPFSLADQEQEVFMPAHRDSTIRAQKPHRNEGANPRLFLSHRLEARNKSLNPIVAFDLANTDLNGLTKATLVMNIQDCDLPRRWGNEGRFIEAHPMTQSWTEGNGNKYRQKGQEGKTKGEGPGVTWFSPADTQIRNNRPNGSSQWSGARMSLGPITAPPVVVTNGQTGPIEFDVTQDVLNGYYEGWLLKKQDEAKFGNIRFFSKEAGDAEIAPKLLLEFNGPIANAPNSKSLLGAFTSFGSKLRPSPSGSELKTLREVLKESPTAARVGEQLLQTAGHINPAVGFVSTTAYRVWLS